MSEPSTPDEPERGAARWPSALVVSTVFLLSSVRIGDADLFWHRAVGAYLLEHDRWPSVDPFSYGADGPLRYTESLAQRLYAWVHRLAGFEGLGVLHAALAAALTWLVARTIPGRASVRAAVAAWVAAASYAATAQKPQIFSYLAFALLLAVLASEERGAARVRFVLPPLFLAWGFLHRAGTLGLGVLVAATVLAGIVPAQRRLFRPRLVVAVASTVALACNPGGLFYFTSAFDLAARASFRAHLADWQPLTIERLLAHHAALLPLVALAVVERLRTRRVPDVELAAIVATGAAAVGSARFVPFLAIALAAPAARALSHGLEHALLRAGDAIRPSVMHALVLALGLGALVGLVLPRIPASFFGYGIDRTAVPVHLARAVARVPTTGRLFHAFDFGGYFVHALAPRRKVLIDGRNDTLYSDAFFDRVIRAETDPAVFAELDRRHRFAIAAFRWSSPGDPSGRFVARDPRWVLVAWDDRGAVYVRRDAVPAEYLARAGYRELSVLTAFRRAANPPQGGDPRDERFVLELDRNTRDAPHSARSWYLTALAHRVRGHREAYAYARARLERIVRERELSLPLP